MLPHLRTFLLIEKKAKKLKSPIVTLVSRRHSLFLVLISCILSLRTKDATTAAAGKRLFSLARTPASLLKLSVSRIEKLIYPVGFYHTKAKVIKEVSRRIIEDFQGLVPHDLESLLSIKGVGRKTANLVLGLGYGIPGICVDTHVHRISNRLGWVRTGTPKDTEFSLMRLFPKRLWVRLNSPMVAFGQNICLPVSPLCSACPVYGYCPRRGVKKHR